MTTDTAPMTASDQLDATLDQPWNGGPVALDDPARARVAAIAGALIASATPAEIDQLAATLDAIRKARAK